MKKKILLYSLLVLLSPVSALAAACSDTDIRDHVPAQVEKALRTPFQQGQLGWCYAYSASDLLTVHLGQQPSPFHIGLMYSASVSGAGSWGRQLFGLKKNGLYDGGTTLDALHLMSKNGKVCSENDVNSNLDSVGLIKYQMKAVESVYKNSADEVDKRLAASLLTVRFPHLQEDGMISLLRSRSAPGVNGALLSMAQASCRGSEISIPSQLKIKTLVNSSAGTQRGAESSQEKIIPFVNKALNSGKPVSLRYNMTNFIAPEYRSNIFMETFSQHVSTIVGRKQKGQQCYYVIRNSWGPTCRGYASGIPCNQDEGTYEISASALKKAAIALEYIEN